MENIWEKDYGPFRVFGYVAPEEMDVREIFDADAFDSPDVDEIRVDVINGKKIWVYATARVFCKGVELGDSSIGGLLYKDYDGIKKGNPGQRNPAIRLHRCNKCFGYIKRKN